jgi:hypothetical protein
VFRRLFEDFSSTDLALDTPTPLAADFAQFRAAGGTLLAAHALFEALHAERFSADASAWNWRNWPAPWRNAASEEVKSFAETNAGEVTFHCFLQWIADRSFAENEGPGDVLAGMPPGEGGRRRAAGAKRNVTRCRRRGEVHRSDVVRIHAAAA